MTPHFKWFYLLVIGTRKTYFKKKKSWVVEVVVFTYKSRETAFGALHTECKVMTVAVQFAYISLQD